MPGDVALSAVSWSPTPITKAGLRGSPPSPPRPGRSLDVWGGIQERNQDSAFTSKLSAKLMACVTLRSAAVISIINSIFQKFFNNLAWIKIMDPFAKELRGSIPGGAVYRHLASIQRSANKKQVKEQLRHKKQTEHVQKLKT